MRRASTLQALILSVISLQLQSARGSPLTWSDNPAQVQAPLSASALVKEAETFIQNGLKSLQGKSVCDHLQTLLTPLGNVGKLTISTSGPPEHDQSLLNNIEFWKVASVQHASDPSYDYIQYLDSMAVQGYFNPKKKHGAFIESGPIIFVAVKPGQTLSLTETLFPGSSSSLPQNKLLNMTFDCTTNQLDVHIQISEGVEVIPQILSFSNLVLSLRVTLEVSPQFHSVILSANTQLFSMATFVAVEYDFNSKEIAIKGVPTDNTSLNMQTVLQAVSGASLKVPSSINAISQIIFYGQVENGLTSIAIKGKNGESVVAVIFQKSGSMSNAAVIADIRNFNLASFVKTALNIDIISIPLFGTLTIPKLGFSAATGKINSSVLPQLYDSGSPLVAFGNSLPKGVSAYFTVNIAGVSVDASFSVHKFAFKVPKTESLSVKLLLDQFPKLSNLDSLPKMVTDVLNSKLSGFNYDPESKFLELGFMIPELTIVPKILKLTTVNFMLAATIGQNPLIQNLKFSGTWKFSTVRLTTSIDYNREKKVFRVKAIPETNGTLLSIDTLVKNVAGVGGKLPSVLTSLSLSSIVGNVYDNGKYFLAISGTVSGGELYLLFYKDTEGVKVGIAASLQSFRLSTLVQSTTGVDISSVPYLGKLIVPAMAVSITSGVIKSPALPHLFGEGSPLLVYGDTLPAGVTSQFDLNIGHVKGAAAKFYNGVLAFQLPESVDFSIKALASKIPSISGAIQALPAQVRDILSAKLISFSFNSTSKDLSIRASLSTLTLVSGFLSISNVSLSYDGTLGKKLTTRMLDFSGIWQIDDYAILTSVMYNGVSKELTIASQSGGGKDLSISNVLQSLAGTTVPLPPVISSFTFTGIIGKTATGTTVVVFNGKVGNGKISAVFQKTSSGSAGAVVVDIANFKLVELVKSATGADISAIPFFGTLEIPELKFAAATNNITSPILRELAGSGSALEWFKTGITQGISGRFIIQIGDVNRVAVNFVHKRLNFKVPDKSSLSLNSLLSVMPKVKEVLSSLPSQLTTILSANINAFSYDPDINELHFSGSINSTVEIVPQFVSLSNVRISLVLVLGQKKHVKYLDISGNWMLKNLLIHTGVSYNREENRLDITGELNAANGGIDIQELITAISGQSLSIPSVLSSVKLSKLSGNKIGDVTLVTLSGSVGNGRIFLIYQKSPSGSAVAFAADIPKFRFSSLVSSTTGIDISNIPFFGTLIIPQIGFTIASKHINNPLLSAIFPSSSTLAKFGESISKGVTASFSVDLADVKGIVADFAKGELDLQVPKTVDLSLASVLTVIPGLQGVIDSLPQTIRDIGRTRLHELYFAPSTKDLKLVGSLDSLAIISNFLSLQNIEFVFAGTIGKGSQVKYVKFKGDWIIKSLSLTTEVFYEKNLLLISGYPTEDKGLNIKELIKSLTDTDLDIPSILNALKFTRVIGKIQDGMLSIVLMGEIGTRANVAIVYEQTKDDKVVSFAADIQEFQLSELVKAGAGIDITNVPFFGKLTIPALSFVISSKQFTTANLPDLNVTGVHVPKELLLDSIPAGVKAQFLADIGSAVGINADYSNNVLTIEVPPTVSLSLQSLLSVIPEIKSTIDSLPSAIKEILSARITKLVFKPITKDLFVSLYIETLTLVPNIMSMKEIKISLDVSLTQSQSLAQIQIGPYSYYQYHHSQSAELQAISVNSLEFEGKWVMRGIEIKTSVVYDKHSGDLVIEGVANNGDGLSITDLIKAFSNSDLSLPSVLSSLKLLKVKAISSNSVTTVIIIARAKKANVYLVFQKLPAGSITAIAADIDGFRLVDLIETALDIDLSAVPFIGSIVISSMAFSASTNIINTPLLTTTFEADSPLQEYGLTIPKGLTAYFKVQIGGTFGVEVTYADKILDFVVPKSISLSLNNLLSEIPSVSSVIKKLPSPISDLLRSELKAMRFDPSSKVFSVAAYVKQISIIPDILEVHNLEVSLVAVLSSSNGGLQSLYFSADWVLRSTSIRIKVSYDKDSEQILFAAIPKNGLNIKKLISTLTNVSLPIPSVINSVEFVKILGRKSGQTFTFIFSGSIGDKAKVHLVYQKMEKISRIAIAAGINSFTFAKLVQSAVNIDISSIPFFGSFSVPSIGLSISKGAITTPLLVEAFAENSPLIKYGTTIPDGFTAKFDIPIGSIKGIIGSYRDKVLSFTVPDNVELSLGSLISVIPGVNVNSIDIAPVFGDILRIRLKSFSFDMPKKELSIEMFLQKIIFYEDVLSMRDIKLKVKAKLSTPRKLSVEGSGIIALGRTDYTINLHQNVSTTKYTLTVETDKLSLFGIVTALGAQFLPEDLQIILGKIFDVNILNAKIVYPLGATPQQIQLSGTPQLFGLKTIRMTAVAFKYSGKIRMIYKFNFGKINIADVIKDLLGVSLHFTYILNQKMDLSFILSPNTMKGIAFSLAEFKGYNRFNQGLSLSAQLRLPSKCDDNPFCAMVKATVGDVQFSLLGTITNARSFSMLASVGNLKLGGGVVLKHAGLEFVGGVSPSFGLVGSIELKTPAITLSAAIRATLQGIIKLEGSMSGCWYKAFGSPYLALCNLYLAMTIAPTPLPITGLEFGGRIELGKKSCGTPVTAEGYVGLNIINPNENYFYAKVGRITFQSFFDAFCIKVSLPKPLVESGFPNGFQTSFTLLGKELPHAGISLPIGFRFKGTINILGLEASSDIILSPNRLKVKIELPPIKIAGLFKMYRSNVDKSKGPFVDADISTKSLPKLEASGFVEVLGISVLAQLSISNTKYEVHLAGKFLNLFQASLRIQASYSKKVNDLNFMVEGHFKSDLFDKIAKAIRDGLQKSADEADKHLTAAQHKIIEKQRKLDRATDSLERKKGDVDHAKRKFDDAVAAVDRARRAVDRICTIRSCGSVCIGCPKGWKCYSTHWGICVAGGIEWDNCCTRVTDPICLAANAGCWQLKKPLDLILQGAIEIVDKSRHILDVAKVALSTAQDVLHGAKGVLEAAKVAFEGIKSTYRVGVNALSALTNLVFTQIINIREVYFKVGLGAASGGEFACRIKGVLMGQNLDINLQFNTRNIWSLVKSLAEKAFSGLSKFIG